MRAHHDETGTKSVRLPSGTVALRKTPDRVDTTGEPDERFARVKTDWDKHALKEATNPGPVAQGYDAPEGFTAREVVDHNGMVVRGAVWLVRVDPAFSFKAGAE